MRKTLIFFCFIFAALSLGRGWAASSPALTISGLVKQPAQFTLETLSKFQSITVRLNEVDQDKNYRGTFNYQGVPLRTLIEQACIQKGKADFNKPIDLAIMVSNKEGKQTVLSWGEIFYRNPAEVTVAFSAVPIMPHKKCESCHKPEVYGRWFNQLKRPLGFPQAGPWPTILQPLTIRTSTSSPSGTWRMFREADIPADGGAGAACAPGHHDRDEDPFDRFRVVPKLARIADVHRIASPPLHRRREVLAADRRGDQLLDVVHGQAVPGRPGPAGRRCPGSSRSSPARHRRSSSPGRS